MGALLDRDIHLCKALVIDGNATSRSILVAQMRDFGIGHVAQCGRIADARTLLEREPFEIVLCEQTFSGTDYSGQQLLDDLRRAQLLPLSTVFVMITGEASYAKVTEAAESALDSYLVKPHTATALGDRISHARRRKRVLKDIFEAVDAGRFDDAAGLCVARFKARGEFWLFAARIGSELLLTQGRHAEAKALFEGVLQAQATPWARLGIARAQMAANENGAAARTLETLLGEQPGYVDAHDVMGRLRFEQGQHEAAIEACRQAATLTPGSVGRLQKLGLLAFLFGDGQEATRVLDRAVSLGVGSKMFDPLTLVLLAFLRLRQQDTKGLQRCAENLAYALSRAEGSTRLERMARVVEALNLLLLQRADETLPLLRDLGAQVLDEGFDLEAACNLLLLAAQAAAAGLAVEGAEGWIDGIGLRYCSSKAHTELLAAAAALHPPYAERLRQCPHRITQIAEEAMAHTLAGDPGAAVRGLIEQGQRTLNGKLLDNARHLLQRHQDRIPDAHALLAEADALRARFWTRNVRLPMADASRAAGGITLRTSVDIVREPSPAAVDPLEVAG
jgi:Tfp pilus assembly protein PilF